MATYSFDDIPLDPGDMGIQWVPGVGFRPVDVTEEYAAGFKGCGYTEDGNQCHEIECSHEKWTPGEKWEVPPVFASPPSLYVPPVYVSSPPVFTDLLPPIWWDTPCCTVVYDPPIWDCCITTTSNPPNDPPFDPPAPVPLPASILFLLAGLFLLKRITS